MKKWLHKFKNWKPIHLCWLFRKLHLPIPRYLVGGGSDFFLQGGRVANATRVWQAAQDVNVIDWDKATDFIVATMLETDTHGSSSTTLYLHWRNVTDGGSFGVLGSSGELTYNADTDLVDGNAVIHSEEGITARYPANHEDGKEIEGIGFKVIILLKEWHEEFQFAVDCSNAHDGDEYEFAIYDSEAATYVGTLACTIRMLEYSLKGGRIANATRIWQAAQDVNVIDWDKATDFIVATMLENFGNALNPSDTLYFQWRNKTDGGSFVNLGSSGELTYNADTDLVDGNPVIHSEEGVTTASTHADGEEKEGSNSTGVISITEGYHKEWQWAVDCSNAHDGDEYEFRIYSSGDTVSLGVIVCTITMAAGAATYTKDFTLDSFLQAVQTKDFTTNGVILKIETQQFDIDALIKLVGTKDFSTDAILLGIFTKNFDIDAFLQKALTKPFDINAVLIAVKTKDFDLDAFLKASFTKGFDIDAVLSGTATKDFDIDAVVVYRFTKDFSIDGVIVNRFTKTFEIDGFLLETLEKLFSIDAVLKLIATKDFSTDAFLKATQTKDFDIDGVVVRRLVKDFSLNALLLLTQIKDFACDAVLKLVATKLFDIDAILTGVVPTKTFDIDAFLQKSPIKDFSFDGVLVEVKTKTFAIDAIISAVTAHTKTFIIDGFLQRALTKVLEADALLQKTQSKTFSIDSVIKASPVKTFTIDANLFEIAVKTFFVDSIIKAIQIKTVDIDSILVNRLTKQFSLDSILINIITKTFSLDSLLKLTTTKDFVIDAFLQKTQSKDFTSDAFLKITSTKDFSLGVILGLGIYSVRTVLKTTSYISTSFDNDYIMRGKISTDKYIKVRRHTNA